MLNYKELRSSQRVDLTEAVPLAAPFTIHIETTNVCNFRCVMCPESFDDYQQLAGYYRKMPFDLFEKIVRDIGEMGARIKALKFYMIGEPLLTPELPRMIALATQSGIADRTEVTSNGSLLTEQKALQLIESGLDYLCVSIYSVDSYRHRQIIGVPQFTPEIIQHNVRRFRELRDHSGSRKPIICAKYMHESNEGESEFLAAYSGSADELELQYRHNMGGSDQRSNDLVTLSYNPDQQKTGDHYRFKKSACPSPFYIMGIKANGDVSPCCVDWSGKLVIGNVARQTLRQIWQGRLLRDIQLAHLSKRRGELEACRDCTFMDSFPDNLDTLSAEEFTARTNRFIESSEDHPPSQEIAATRRGSGK